MLTCDAAGWSGFCGGRMLWNIRLYVDGSKTPKKESARDILIHLMTAYCKDVSSFVMADTVDGVAGENLFSKLGGLQGEVEAADPNYSIGWVLSSPFRNGNSGNEVQILTAWKIYTQDYIDSFMKEDEDEEF